LSASRLDFALKTLKTTVLNVDEFNSSINKVKGYQKIIYLIN